MDKNQILALAEKFTTDEAAPHQFWFTRDGLKAFAAEVAALAAVPQAPSDERARGYSEGLDAAYAAMFDIKGDKVTRFDAQTAIRKLKEARAQATPGALTSEAEDAARYRFIVADALGELGVNDFTSYQPSGYNGGDHVWIEFGFKHPKWTKATKEDIDKAIDAARASGEC